MDIVRRLRALLERGSGSTAAPSPPQEPEGSVAVPDPLAADTAAGMGEISPAPPVDLSSASTLAGGAVSPRPPAAPAEATKAAKLPKRIGRYEIQEELGRGGMGVVYKARDPQIGRTVAIKSILPARFLEADELPQYEQRFYRESQAAGKLSHPGIVAVHDLIFDDELPAMVMEFVEGASLDQLMARERLPLERCVEVILGAAEALHYAHGRGIVHRDVKPANILITRDGQVKITDFGIAKLDGAKLTKTGQIVGTPAFMSPEQFVGSPVDRRSDIFSLGSVFYWLCTGQKPFPGKTLSALGIQLVQRAPTPACQLNPALPPEVDVILSRMMAKEPGGRYADGERLAADLRALQAGRPLSPAAVAALPAPPS